MPKELTLLVETFGTLEEEARLHKLFAPYHVRGEWFLSCPLLKELIEYLVDGGSLQTWLEGL